MTIGLDHFQPDPTRMFVEPTERSPCLGMAILTRAVDDYAGRSHVVEREQNRRDAQRFLYPVTKGDARNLAVIVAMTDLSLDFVKSCLRQAQPLLDREWRGRLEQGKKYLPKQQGAMAC